MFSSLRKYRLTIAHWSMELLIVVAGVLIALSAQQWAEEQSSKRRAGAAEARIREELGANVLNGVERIAVHQCLKQRLMLLADGLNGGRSDWSDLRMPDIDEGRMAFRRLYRMPSRSWVSIDYQASLESGALDSLDLGRSARLAGVYAQVQKQRDFNLDEGRLATQLAVLQFKQPSSETRHDLLATLMRLDNLNASMVLMSRQNIQDYRNLYRVTSQEAARAHQQKLWPALVAEMRAKYGACVDANAIAELDGRLLH